MKFTRDLYNPPLQVVGFVGTRRGDEERGPAVSLNREEASLRLLADGELVFIHGPRRKELAPVIVDDEVPRGGVVVRDIAGLMVSDVIKLVKPDMDRGPAPARTELLG
jgi:anaerobic selenocysteine-containing dehydrogenase